MFHRTTGILNDAGDDPKATSHIDADLIMTAAVVGFCVANLEEDNPVEFGAEATDADAGRDLELVVSRLDKVLPAEHGGKIKATRTPELDSNLITAGEGSAKAAFAQRHIEINEQAAEQLRNIARSVTDPIGYQGRGAYTGLVSDPVNHLGNITSTMRRNVPEDYGDRWVMPGYPHDGLAWGLIGGVASVGDGMVEQPMNGADLVGYVHGMTQAVYRAQLINRERLDDEPSAVPYEVAVGRYTTKLASCFGCTLFMYANNYPPSCIHLGRADSWAPLYPLHPADPDHNEMDDVFTELNDAWSAFCHERLLIGAELLAGDGMRHVADDEHRARLPLVHEYLVKHRNRHDGGNLVLDALTTQEKVTAYLLHTLTQV